MRKTLSYIFLFSFLMLGQLSYSQNMTEAAARAELQRRGYDETRFREELNKKGVNIDAVDPNNPVEVAKAEKAVREVMEILDKEKKENSVSKVPAPPTPQETKEKIQPTPKTTDPVNEINVFKQSKEIKKAVKDGATLEEAVTESIQEATKKVAPPSGTYGQHIFRDKSLTVFRSSEDAKPSSSYILGPGDKVAISIWGPSQENFALEISKDGYIQPTGLKRFYLAGLRIDAAEQLLITSLKSKYYFEKENFAMTVTTARTINVNIVGEVFTSGTYNISAINTAFNALVAAGGPNDIGSVRNIQIRRPGSKKNIILDVYKFLQDPIISQDFHLQENDYINVPVAEKLVTISGAVNRAFRYELLGNEHLKELIKFAGGLKSTALKGNIKVTRIESDSLRIIDVNFNQLEKTGLNFDLRNGDLVEIFEITSAIRNEISISGAVENPGKYALNDNPRISDLLNKAILDDNALTSVAYIKRFNGDLKTIRYELVNLDNIIKNASSADNIRLQKGDELIVSSQASFVDSYKVTIEGAVRDPKVLSLDKSQNLKVADAVFFAGGLKTGAADFAYIIRADKTDPKKIEYIYVNVQDATTNPTSIANISLEPDDKLMFYSKGSFTDDAFVSIDGAVRRPDKFVYSESLTLKDVILLAEGLKQEASLDRIDVYRLSFEEGKSTRILAANLKINDKLEVQNSGGTYNLQPFDQIYVRTAPEYELQRYVSIEGEVRYPGNYVLLRDNTKLAAVLKDAGSTTEEAFLRGATLKRSIRGEEGFIIINLEKAINSPNSPENIILQEGDVISIPKMRNTVTISGAVKIAELYIGDIANQSKVQTPFFSGKSAKFYIDEYAGGFAKNADKKNIAVISPTGKVTKAKSFFGLNSYPKVTPGSEIKVGFKEAKPEGKETEKEDVKWGDILANSVAQATAILSLILLVQNVN